MNRIYFSPGATSASVASTIYQGQPQRFILSVGGGQHIGAYTNSHGDPLQISIAMADGTSLPLYGDNGVINNSIQSDIPYSGDVIVTVTPVVPAEGPELNFDFYVEVY